MKRVLLIVLMLIACMALFAQNFTIAGHLSDTSRRPPVIPNGTYQFAFCKAGLSTHYFSVQVTNGDFNTTTNAITFFGTYIGADVKIYHKSKWTTLGTLTWYTGNYYTYDFGLSVYDPTDPNNQ